MNAPHQTYRHVSGRCLCGAVELEIDFPAFWAWHDHSAASRRAHGAAYATYIGCWRKHARVVKGQRSIARFEDANTESTRSFCSRYGLRCFTSASARRTWSISRGHSSAAVPAASPAITSPSRSFRIGPTQATGLSPSRAIPVSSGNARNRAGARVTLMTLKSSTASRPRLRISSGEGCVHSLRAAAATNAPTHEADIPPRSRSGSGTRMVSTTWLCDRRKMRPEDSLTFRVRYQWEAVPRGLGWAIFRIASSGHTCISTF